MLELEPFFTALHVWNAEGGEERFKFEHSGGAVAFEFNPTGDQVASASRKALRVWGVNTGRLLRELSPIPPNGMRLMFSVDGKRLVHAGGQVLLVAWDTETFKEAVIEEALLGLRPSLSGRGSVSPDGHILWSVQL